MILKEAIKILTGVLFSLSTSAFSTNIYVLCECVADCIHMKDKAQLSHQSSMSCCASSSVESSLNISVAIYPIGNSKQIDPGSGSMRAGFIGHPQGVSRSIKMILQDSTLHTARLKDNYPLII